MRTTNFDAIAAAAPLDRTASVVRDGTGDQWDHQVHEQISHWKAPPLATHPRPPGVGDITGRTVGRLTVVRFHGYREGKNAPPVWLVRCACGDYEVRRNTTLLKASDPDDCCVICRKAQHLRERASRPPSKKGLRKQRAAFNRIVGGAA